MEEVPLEGEQQQTEDEAQTGHYYQKLSPINNNVCEVDRSCPTTRAASPCQPGKRKRRQSGRSQQHRDSLHVKFNAESSGSPSESSSDEEESSSSQYSTPQAPDGGWGWVVVAASFLINLIGDGVTFSFGIIYVEFLNYFGEGKGTTAWIAGMFMAMPLLSGPVASFLTDRFGCRRVAIFGAILAAIGFIISAFANSMFVLFLTFGVFAGFGLSLCYVAAVVIVAYYFDKRRSTATGLSVCGSGIGTYIFAPLTGYLLDEYGWRGTILILAGLFLNICVCGALMRDLPWTADCNRAKRQASRRKRTLSQRTSSDSLSMLREKLASGTVPEELVQSLPDSATPRLSNSLLNIPTFLRSGEKVPPEVLELLSTHRSVYDKLVQNYPSLLVSSKNWSDSGSLGEQATIMSVKSAPPMTLSPVLTDPPSTKSKDKSGTAPRKLPTAYLKDLRVHRHSLTYRGAMLNINRYRLRASSCPDIYRNSMTTIAEEKQEWYMGAWEFYYLLADMLDLSYFLDTRFLLFAISNFLLYTWYDVPYVYLVDSAIEMGYSKEDSSYLISTIGILNMIGEIGLGWIGDCPKIDPNVIYAGCMLLCGGATALLPVVSSYGALQFFAAAFGLTIAANYSLTSIILVELISIERFTNGYGLLLLVQGIANLIGPPLAGWIYDMTGTYDLTFYLAGIFIALSGLLLLILPTIGAVSKRSKRRSHSKANGNLISITTPNAKSDALSWEKGGIAHHV